MFKVNNFFYIENANIWFRFKCLYCIQKTNNIHIMWKSEKMINVKILTSGVRNEKRIGSERSV